jgi:hypothetical protein
MNEQLGLNMKWVVLGAILIIALNQVLSYLLIEPVGIPLINSMGLIGGLLVFVMIIAVGSFFVGGILIGRMSPGVTIKEAGYASVAAIAVNVVLNTIITGQFPGILGIVIIAAIGYGLGVAGAKVGESWQSKVERAQSFPHARAAYQQPAGPPPGFVPLGGPPPGGFPPQGGPPPGGGFPPQGGPPPGSGFPPQS